MGGWVDCIFFLPNHVFLIPEVLLTQKIMFKLEYMEECLERPTEIKKEDYSMSKKERHKKLGRDMNS